MSGPELKTLVNKYELDLYQTIESTPSCLKIINKDGQLLSMNPRGIGIIEAENEESVLGADVYSIVEETHRDKFIAFNKRICGGESGTLIFEIIGLKGTRRWMETYASPFILVNGETAHIAITNEITQKVLDEEKLAEQRLALIDSSRLASLGQLAGGIAHEINNPLAIIRANASLLKAKVTQPNIDVDDITQRLGKIEDTVMRISSIIRGLKSFSRDSKNDPKEISSLSAILRDSISLCSEKFKNSGIEVQCHFDEDVEFECRGVQLSQVFMNLLNNSYDAIEKLEKKWIRIELSKLDDNIYLRFTDSGNGISEDILQNMMTPFFTTKEVGRGTGLGLSISFGIIRDHGGFFEYQRNNKNTQFLITFPCKTK